MNDDPRILVIVMFCHFRPGEKLAWWSSWRSIILNVFSCHFVDFFSRLLRFCLEFPSRIRQLVFPRKWLLDSSADSAPFWIRYRFLSVLKRVYASTWWIIINVFRIDRPYHLSVNLSVFDRWSDNFVLTSVVIFVLAA